MALYLVQHGKALSGESDPGLSGDGRADAIRIASVARDYRVPVSAILHSGKKRAMQTALIFADILGPGIPVGEESGMAPKDDAADFAGRLDLTNNRMYVGHLPFMERLASFLVTGSIERPVFKFQNGGIVCIDLHPELNMPVITWALMPNIQ